MWKCAKYGKAGMYQFGMGRETGFSVVCSPGRAEYKPCCRGKGGSRAAEVRVVVYLM